MHINSAVSEITYTVSSWTLNPSIPYHTIQIQPHVILAVNTVVWAGYFRAHKGVEFIGNKHTNSHICLLVLQIWYLCPY